MRYSLVICFLITLKLLFGQNTIAITEPIVFYENALDLFQKKQYSSAQLQFEQYIKLGNSEALIIDCEYYTCICALELFQDNAEHRFKSFLVKYPTHPKTILANYELGNFYLRQKNYTKAIDRYLLVDKAILAKDELLEYQFNLAYAYFNEKNFEKSGPIWNSLKKDEHKYTYAASYYAGYVNFKNGLFDEAIKDFLKAQKNDAYKALVPVNILNTYYKQKAYNQMIAYVEEFEKTGVELKNRAEFDMLAAEAYFKAGKYKESIPYFEKFSGKMYPDTTYRYGFALLKTNSYAKAIEQLKTINQNNRLGQFALFYLGMAYLLDANKTYAANAFAQSSQMRYDDTLVKPSSYFYAGKVYFDLRQFSEAIDYLKTFVSRYPNHPNADEAAELLGESYLNTSDFDEAISYIEKLKRRSERVNIAYQKVTFYKAMANFNDGKIEECIALLNKSLNYRYNKVFVQMATFWKGEALSLNKDYQNAISSYNDMPSSDAKLTAKSFYGLGYAYYNLKNYDQAEKYFKMYLEKKSLVADARNYADALVRLADCQFVAKNYDLAYNTYDQAIATNVSADVDYILFQKANIALVQNKAEKAQDLFELLIRRYPNSTYYDNALFQKAEIDFKQNNYGEAIKSLTEAISKRPNSQLVASALLNRSTAYENLRQYNEAEGDLYLIIRQFPQSEEARKALDGLQQLLNKNGKGELFDSTLATYKQNNPSQSGLENIEFESIKTSYFSEKYTLTAKNAALFIKNYPQSIHHIDVVFFYADSKLQLKDSTEALKNFYTVLEANKSEFHVRALRASAEIELAKKNVDVAKRLYFALLSRTNTKKGQISASLGLLESYYAAFKYDSCIYFANQVISIGNASVNASNKSNLFAGKAYAAKGDTTKAMDVFLDLLNNATDEYAAEANFLLATVLYKKRQYRQSIDKLFHLNEKFAGYPRWANSSYLLLADNYLAINEIFQAKATLKSIIDKSKDKILVEKAKEKLEAIK